MDYEDLDSILKAKESDSLRNPVASVESFSRVHEWLSNEPTADPPPPSTSDALSVLYARINRGDRNNSRSVDCWNSPSNSSCPYEGNGDGLYSVVRKTSASAGFDIYGDGGANYSTIGHTSPYNATSPGYNFYQLEKPLESSVNYLADSRLPEDYYDVRFNPYEEVTIRDSNDRSYDFAAADRDENELYSCIRSDDKIDDRYSADEQFQLSVFQLAFSNVG